MKPGETIAETAIREVREETALEIEITGLVGIYTDPRHVIAYADGEVRQEFNVCFAARVTTGTPVASVESSDISFILPSDLTALAIHPTTRLRISHYLEWRPMPYIG